ncbi:chitooligosaccharide deacetylase [Virgisporangium aliadipatigenens]|uniref:Chitooligosaccharide deacetylase n=1 Tax=Virgisporangium aliadipatigenens TaxID=741659 RepID=A0A8J4DTM3_9ACTN|nr:polysaccharide deacetylase family protein [Virgisporangium aliadipatigenens]GIJ49153.1 chitooligosaccharide deacetylase [Virgisporangium aliadipatigenens]
MRLLKDAFGPVGRAALAVAAALAVLVGSAAAPGAPRGVFRDAPANSQPTQGPVPASPSSNAPPPVDLRPELAARLPKFEPAPPAEAVNVPPSGPAAPWLGAIPTTQKVAFLTIDDGWEKNPEAVKLLLAARIPVALFLTIDAIRDNPDFFKGLQAAGATIEAHTISHPSLRGKSYEFQKHQICGSADQLGAWFGRRPTLFRPPFGEYDAVTLKAVHDCGMRAALFWRETVDKGKVKYQSGGSVAAGDILLMHFRPAYVDDFLAALEAIHAAGLTPAALTDYLK